MFLKIKCQYHDNVWHFPDSQSDILKSQIKTEIWICCLYIIQFDVHWLQQYGIRKSRKWLISCCDQVWLIIAGLYPGLDPDPDQGVGGGAPAPAAGTDVGQGPAAGAGRGGGQGQRAGQGQEAARGRVLGHVLAAGTWLVITGLSFIALLL